MQPAAKKVISATEILGHDFRRSAGNQRKARVGLVKIAPIAVANCLVSIGIDAPRGQKKS